MDNQNVLVFGSIVGIGIIIATVSAVYLSEAYKPDQVPQTSPTSIEISGLRESYRVGERLNFTINTYGICATPNLVINRYDNATGGSILVFGYGAEPVHCGPFLGPAAEPHFIWYADRLGTRISDEA
jgi:hypothetical protein